MSAAKHTFIIAEAGVNHDGDVHKALELVDLAARSGADAVKFQTFSAERLVTREAPKAEYQQRALGDDGGQLSMLRKLELDEGAHRALLARAASRGIEFMSTPFDEEAADFLLSLGITRIKVPSGELTNLPFLAHVAKLGKPLIVSTGMATLGELDRALETIRSEAPGLPVTVLHCTSTYPAEPDDVNLRAMLAIGTAFGVPVGYSDHTLGIEVPIAAAALGAAVIEKHFTLDKTASGPDHAMSLDGDELSAMVRSIRNVERALGDGVKRPRPQEREVAAVARKSIVARRLVRPGEVIVEADLVMRRPGTGLGAELLPFIVGRHARVEIPEGTLVTLEHLT